MLKSMRFTFKPSNQMVNATMKKKNQKSRDKIFRKLA